jgi:hypothetical protein
MIDTLQSFPAIYNKGKWLFPNGFVLPRTSNLSLYNSMSEVEPDVRIIYHQTYEVKYEYLMKNDSIMQNRFGVFWCEGLITTIPMFYLPLETDVYYKKNNRKYLVKKRIGFCSMIPPFEDHLADYCQRRTGCGIIIKKTKNFYEQEHAGDSQGKSGEGAGDENGGGAGHRIAG